ncbi:MAG: L-threonylcarbamoyladenylate synthase [bacterium]
MPLDLIPDAVARLRSGGLVAFPTETVYGLGADALNPHAVERVFAVKGRPINNPLIVHVTGVEMAQRLVQAWPADAATLAQAFWPGPLTLVLPRSARVPAVVAGGGANVGIRCPDHPVAMALLFAFGGPLVGPSANKSGGVSPTRAEHVREQFADDVVLTLDGGACATGIESTVLLLAGGQAGVPTILRPGVIGPEAIAQVLRRPVAMASGLALPVPSAGTADMGGAQARPLDAPGLLASHYAPHARAALFNEWDEVEEFTEEAGGPVVVLSHSVAAEQGAWELIPMPHDALQYAACLYSAMRSADDTNPALILIQRPPAEGETPEETAVWHAIADRLCRATAAR